jgi:hypothetical protein
LGTSKERLGSVMGFRKPIDFNSVNHQIHMAGVEINYPGNDGYTQFEIKKDLLLLKWTLDSILSNSPTFAGEEEWIEECEKAKMWDILNR